MERVGDRVAQYQKKGNKIAVSGSIQIRNYEDNQGVKRTAVDVIAQDVEFLTPRSADRQPAQDITEGQKIGYQMQIQGTRAMPVLQAIEDDEDIPF